MQVTCPRCHAALRGDAIDLASRTAVCQPCGEVVSLSTLGATTQDSSLAVYRPSDIRWVEVPDGPGATLVISSPPRGPGIVLLCAAAFYGLLLGSMLLTDRRPPMAVLVFLGLVELGLIAGGLVAVLNSVFIRVDAERITLRSGPIPIRRATTELLANLVGFQVGGRSGNQATWGVHALTRDGRSIRLAMVFRDQTHATHAAARLSALLTEHQSKVEPYRD
jgi:hypothetical protein